MNRLALSLLLSLPLFTSTGLHAGEQAFSAPRLAMSERIEAPWARRVAIGVPQYGIALQLSGRVDDGVVRELVLNKGMDMMGTRYEYGANRDDAVDCSSLVQQMYLHAGIDVPRTTREQIRIGHAVDVSSVEPGDLMFYRFGPSGLHVAVYLDDGHVLHASTTRRKVIRSRLNRVWESRFVAARRLL